MCIQNRNIRISETHKNRDGNLFTGDDFYKGSWTPILTKPHPPVDYQDNNCHSPGAQLASKISQKYRGITRNSGTARKAQPYDHSKQDNKYIPPDERWFTMHVWFVAYNSVWNPSIQLSFP